MKKILALVMLLPSLALADVVVRGGGSSNQAKVNTDGSLQVNEGPSRRVTYIATANGMTTTAAYNLSLEAESGRGFKLSAICVSVSGGSTNVGVTVSVQRRSTASTGGTAMTSEGTTTNAISKMDPADPNWTGVGRISGTLGTAGPLIDSWAYQLASLTSGGTAPFCRVYGANGEKLPTVQAGVANGMSINVSLVAGGLAFGTVSATMVTEN